MVTSSTNFCCHLSWRYGLIIYKFVWPHVYKVTVVVDMLGNIRWICPLAPGTATDVLIWGGYGLTRTRGDFFNYEVGGHDGDHQSLCFCCILRKLAFGSRSVTLCMDHGTMSYLMCELTKATQLPHKMRERMRQRCVVKSAPPSLFLVTECIDPHTCGDNTVC